MLSVKIENSFRFSGCECAVKRLLKAGELRLMSKAEPSRTPLTNRSAAFHASN